ncbi:MAG: hypothetical protein LBI68_10750 [Azoarcus sp.]|nr:hypothetical protein [Azoarcus sp.]
MKAFSLAHCRTLAPRLMAKQNAALLAALKKKSNRPTKGKATASCDFFYALTSTLHWQS